MDSFNVVKILLENGANIEAVDGDGDTALICASRYNYINTIELLLSEGANMEAKNNRGDTFLHYLGNEPPPKIRKAIEKNYEIRNSNIKPVKR